MRTNLKNEWTRLQQMNQATKFIRIYKKLDAFDLGFLLINLALGEFEVSDLQGHHCTHICEDLRTVKYTCCCLYHCVVKQEEFKHSKLKLKNFLNESLFSHELIEFICFCTSYSLTANPFYQSINKFKFLSSAYRDEKNSVSLEEMLLLSKEKIRKEDYLVINSPARLETVIENLGLILPHCESYFKVNGMSSSEQIFTEQLLGEDLSDLAGDFKIDKGTLINKLKSLFDNIFA